MKKILHVMAVKPTGGVGTFLKNIYDEKFEFEFDIIESGDRIEGDFDHFFKDRGSSIFLLPSLNFKNLLPYYLACEKFYRNNYMNYSAVHIHSTAVAIFHLHFAKKFNINTRIFHGHGIFSNSSPFSFFKNYITKKIISNHSTALFSCGIEVGNELFDKSTFSIVPNGIIIEKFQFDLEKRNLIRRKCNLVDNDLVIGIVGRFDNNKNQRFVLKLASLMTNNKKIKFYFFGDGPSLKFCIDLSKKLKLDNVKFFGSVPNIADYYNAFDILLLPSAREGFSLVSIESQCNGLPVLFSDTLPRSMKILDESLFLSTRSDIVRWRKIIETHSTNLNKRALAHKIVASKYSVNVSRDKLTELYEDLLYNKGDLIK